MSVSALDEIGLVSLALSFGSGTLSDAGGGGGTGKSSVTDGGSGGGVSADTVEVLEDEGVVLFEVATTSGCGGATKEFSGGLSKVGFCRLVENRVLDGACCEREVVELRVW